MTSPKIDLHTLHEGMFERQCIPATLTQEKVQCESKIATAKNESTNKKTHTIANAALADERKTTHTQEHAEHKMMAINEEYFEASKHL